MTTHAANKTKRLSQALLLSGLLNMAVLAFLAYWMVKESPPTPYCESRPVQKQLREVFIDERSAEKIFAELHAQPFQELVERLEQSQIIENGYAERDFALACLIAYHDFDIARALQPQGEPKQKRALSWKKGQKGTTSFTIYPNLSDEHYEAILHFARTEKWPLTAHGLFKRIKEGQPEVSLAESFYHTQEFWAVELLFKRLENPIEKERLLSILLEIGWEPLRQFALQQRVQNDLSETRRQTFLIECIKNRSGSAAFLLVERFADFALKKLEDPTVIQVLALLKERSDASEEYAKQMLRSPRGGSVWKAAAARLYAYAGETVPQPWDYQKALARFLPDTPIMNEVVAAVPSSKPEIKPAPKQATHTVQEGDTLWKISRKYKVDVNVLKKTNHLSSDAIKPGTSLKIP